jgi:PadR family transcriptional regulator
MTPANTQLLQGTLDLLILRVLALGPLHGLGIADRIAQVTGGALQIKAGSLFPALYRLEANGLASGSWGESQSGRRARLYTLTKQGRKRLAEQKKSWTRAALAIQQVLEMS